MRIRFHDPEGLTSTTARDHILPTLQRAGYSGNVETVMLLVDELVSNAPGTRSYSVVLEVSQNSVRVALDDVAVSRFELSAATWTGIFEELADSWGCDVGALGTSVWFTVGRPGD